MFPFKLQLSLFGSHLFPSIFVAKVRTNHVLTRLASDLFEGSIHTYLVSSERRPDDDDRPSSRDDFIRRERDLAR